MALDRSLSPWESVTVPELRRSDGAEGGRQRRCLDKELLYFLCCLVGKWKKKCIKLQLRRSFNPEVWPAAGVGQNVTQRATLNMRLVKDDCRYVQTATERNTCFYAKVQKQQVWTSAANLKWCVQVEAHVLGNICIWLLITRRFLTAWSTWSGT